MWTYFFISLGYVPSRIARSHGNLIVGHLRREIYRMSVSVSHLKTCGALQVALVVKNPPASAKDTRHMGAIPGSGRSPGATHSSVLVWKIP